VKKYLAFLLACGALLSPGCGHRRGGITDGGAPISGPDTSTIPLYRTQEDGPRIYVEADLGDGVPRFFLVDTGAAVTTVSDEVADALGLVVEERGNWLRGVAGQVSWRESQIDAVQLGRFTVRDVDVAVGVPGVPSSVGAVPLAGLMGNNVWKHFSLAIDYPAGVMELHRPGNLAMPETAQPMSFTGQHIIAPARLSVPGDGESEPLEQTVIFTVDTGAGGLLMSGNSVQGLEQAATEGVELIFGVGRGDDLPISNFLRETRRIPVTSVEIGGVTVEEPFTATWLSDDPRVGNLLGHTVLDRHRVLIDYQAQKLALVDSTLPAAQPNVHDRYGAWLKKRRGGKDELLDRVEVMVFQQDYDGAADLLRHHLRANEEDAQAAIMLARLTRYRGDPPAAIEMLRALPLDRLIEHRALVSLVNALWLSGDLPGAIQLAEQATEASPDSPTAWLALSDARRASGDLRGARVALRTVNDLDQNPDGHLLRRAWVASEEGDHYAALTHIRRLIELYPSGSVAPWFYALEVKGTEDTALFLEDIARARGRLHPGDGPLDFFAGAYSVIGESDQAVALMDEGLARDCAQMSSPDSQSNCEAWYHALTRQQLEDAMARIQATVDSNPHRSDYLDTLAVVLEARGELEAARDAAWQAAALDPDDVYFLWQAARLNRAAGS